MKLIDNVFPNMRRILLVGALTAISALGLAACGTNADSASSPTATAPAASMAANATDTPGDTSSVAAAPTQAPSDTSAAPPANQAPANQGAANGTQINATVKEWAIDLSQKEVAAGTVQFVVTNQGMMRHNLTVKDSTGSEVASTPNFATADGPQTLQVDLKPGTYTIICSLPGHAARGQQTELVVK